MYQQVDNSVDKCLLNEKPKWTFCFEQDLGKSTSIIRSQVTAENYSTYFRPLNFVGIENGVARGHRRFWRLGPHTLHRFVSRRDRHDCRQRHYRLIETVQPKQRSSKIIAEERQDRNDHNDESPSSNHWMPANPEYCFERFVIDLQMNWQMRLSRQHHADLLLSTPLFLYGPTASQDPSSLRTRSSDQRRKPKGAYHLSQCRRIHESVVKHIRTAQWMNFVIVIAINVMSCLSMTFTFWRAKSERRKSSSTPSMLSTKCSDRSYSQAIETQKKWGV